MRKSAAFIVAGLALSVLLVAAIGPWASSEPDGLTKVAREQGFASTEDEHALEEGPVAHYEVEGMDSGGMSKALSGILGIAATFIVGAGLFAIVRGRSGREAGDET